MDEQEPRSMSSAKQRLWHHLNSDEVDDHNFKMHHPIGPYTCDFVWLERKLIIELINEQGVSTKPANYTRTKYLEILRFRVIWIRESDILQKFEGVKKTIERELNSSQLRESEIREPDLPLPYFDDQNHNNPNYTVAIPLSTTQKICLSM